MKQIQYGYEVCPGCNSDLDGGMIPVERRRLFHGAERYSLLRVRYDAHGDGLDYLECPSCKERIIL